MHPSTKCFGIRTYSGVCAKSAKVLLGEDWERRGMIGFSQSAKDCFRFMMPLGFPEGEVWRLDIPKIGSRTSPPTLAVYFGEPEEGDRSIEHRGEPLLYVARKVCAAYDGCVVDTEQTPEGPSFVIGPPYSGQESR